MSACHICGRHHELPEERLRAEVERLTKERDEWRDVAKAEGADEEHERKLVREVERLREALLKRGLSSAPCDICGYNGPGYYQSEQHACAALATEVKP